jgi:hypothetical protein
MRKHFCIVLFLLGSSPAAAQNVSVGVRGGVPLTDLVSTVQSQAARINSNFPRYIVGPTFEVRLPFGLGFHVDALYRKMSFEAAAGQAASSASYGFWQFPVMLKYRMGAGPFRPFVSGGPSFSKLTGSGGIGSCAITAGANNCIGRVLNDGGTGFALGTGLDMRFPFIRLAPEIRYTRLGADFVGGPNAPDALRFRRNQWEFLVGLTF